MGFSPHLLIHFAISPSSSAEPFFLYYSRLEILFDKQFEEKQRTFFSTVSACYIEMTYCGLSNKHPLKFHHEDGSSMNDFILATADKYAVLSVGKKFKEL